jgi:hypothetical protein
MKLFKTEQDAIIWIAENIPFAVKPKKKSKHKLIYSFSSGNAQQQVIEHLGKELYKLQENNNGK